MHEIRQRFDKLRTHVLSFISTLSSYIQKLEKKYHDKRRLRKPTILDKKLVAHAHGKLFPGWKNIKIFPKVLSKKEYSFFRLFSVLLALSSLALIINGYSKLTQERGSVGGEYREGLIGRARYINPLYAPNNQADHDIARLIFSSLYQTDSSGNIIPDLANDIKIENDGKKYIIEIKKNVSFHDGHELKAIDVIETFKRIKNKDYKSPTRTIFQSVNAKIINDYKIEFELESSNPAFQALLTFGVMPEHLWRDVRSEDALLSILNIKPVGSGPYKFSSLIKDVDGATKSITLESYNNYHGDKPKIAKITFTFLPNQDEAIIALKNKSIDGLAFIGVDMPKELRRRVDLKIYQPTAYQYNAIFFNTKSSILGESSIRQALSLATDKQKLYDDVLKNDGTPMIGPIPAELISDQNQATPPLDVLGANKLLDESGFLRGEDGFRKKIIKAKNKKEKDGEIPLEIKFITTDNSRNVKTADIIRGGWESLGVKTNLEVFPLSGVGEFLRQRKYDALLYGEALAEDLDIYPFWHSSEINYPGLNLSLFTSRETDNLLEKARKESQFNKKLNYYAELTKIFEREVPAIFLWSLKSNYAISSKIKGVNLKKVVNPSDRFNGITNWYIKSERVLK